MRISALTDIGLVRERNEDAYWFDSDRGIFILADGLGGHKGGEVAAALAVKITADRLSLAIDEGNRGEQLADVMQEAFTVASEEVYNRAQESDELSGMGCSLIAGILRDDRCFVAHAGDSRAYLFFDQTLSQITVDDTPVAALVKRGFLLPEKARSHTLRNFLIKSVGTKSVIDANISIFPVKPYEKILFCSDGLWGRVEHDAICSILWQHPELESACKELVKEAKEKGGSDNITVILVEVQDPSAFDTIKTAEMPKQETKN